MKKKAFIQTLAFVLLILQGAVGQDAMTELKQMAFANPYHSTNENFINMNNAMENSKLVSVLLFDEWKPMVVEGYLEDNIIIDSANYHVKDDKIIFVHKGVPFELYPEMFDTAIIAGKPFVSSLYETSSIIAERSYFEILVEGEYTLMRRFEVDEKTVNESPLGLPHAKEYKLEIIEKLYYTSPYTKRPEELPRKKADFVRIFRKSRNKVVDYAKENKLSPKQTEDMQLLFEFYNSEINSI